MVLCYIYICIPLTTACRRVEEQTGHLLCEQLNCTHDYDQKGLMGFCWLSDWLMALFTTNSPLFFNPFIKTGTLVNHHSLVYGRHIPRPRPCPRSRNPLKLYLTKLARYTASPSTCPHSVHLDALPIRGRPGPGVEYCCKVIHIFKSVLSCYRKWPVKNREKTTVTSLHIQ